MKIGAWSLLILLGSLLFFANQTAAQTTNWQTEIYDNQWLNGQPVVRRTDGAIGFNWGTNAPSGNVESDFFSVRWTSQMFLEANSRIRFNVRADDGIRVFVDGQTVLYAWEGQAKAGAAADRWLTAGSHTVVVEYYEHSGNAYAFFDFETVETDADRPDLIPTVTPSVPLPTTTPLPFSTNTPRPRTPVPTWTREPFKTNTPRPATPVPTWTPLPANTSTPRPFPTSTPLPTHIVPTARPTQTLTPTSTPASPRICDFTPQLICRYYWSAIYRGLLP